MENRLKTVRNVISNQTIIQAKPLDNEVEVFNSSVLILEMDMNENIVYVNRRCISLTGFNEHELVGSHVELIHHPDMPKGVWIAMWKIINERKIWRGYIKYLCKDGSYFWTLTYIQGKLDNDDQIVGFISVGKIAYKNERKKAEEMYIMLKDDKHINAPYFMASEDYYEKQILPKITVNEYIEEAKSLKNKN